MPGASRTVILALALLGAAAIGRGGNGDEPRCATTAGPRADQVTSLRTGLVAPPGIGGRHITARGTLRILVVFASFYDDETPHPYWPPHQPPVGMSEFIDPDTLTRSPSPVNLTRYFREMSLGQFNVVGDAIWVESLQSKNTYLQSGSYGLANWNVIHDRVDPVVDFSQYDNWTNGGDYLNTNAPDSIVDMVIMVWKTTVFQILGEASLGYKPGFLVDGKRLEMGYPERLDAPLGSGVTCQYSYADRPERVTRTMAHELGHWLLGGPHPYNGTAPGGKRQYWGILCAGERFSSCANTYERERLGWITVPELPPDSTAALADYLTTGNARKIRPLGPGTEEAFYLENHQLLSDLDDVTRARTDRGIWILHQAGPYAELDNLRILPSDGGWLWDGETMTTACFGQQLPVFMRGAPFVPFGRSHRDQIVTTSSAVNWIYVRRSEGGEMECGTFAAGEGFDGAFTAARVPVFSPYSNPSSHSWSGPPTGVGVEILSDSGGVARIRRYSDPLAGSPARRHLGIDPTVSSPPGGVALAWGTQWPDGQLLESDVTHSDLQRRIGIGGEWESVYQGTGTSWTESVVAIQEGGPVQVEYRVRVVDAGGKGSAWSPPFRTGTLTTGLAGGAVDPDGSFALAQNFPNPFNALTRIELRIQNSEFLVLRVYDVLGNEVATLLNERKPPGVHSVEFDGSRLASGVYFCRLTAGRFLRTMPILLLR